MHKEQDSDVKYELPENLQTTTCPVPGASPPKMQHLVPLDTGIEGSIKFDKPSLPAIVEEPKLTVFNSFTEGEIQPKVSKKSES